MQTKFNSLLAFILLISCLSAFSLTKTQDFTTPIPAGSESTSLYTLQSESTYNYSLIVEINGTGCIQINNSCDELDVLLNGNICSFNSTFTCVGTPVVGGNTLNLTIRPNLMSPARNLISTIVSFTQEEPPRTTTANTPSRSSSSGGSFAPRPSYILKNNTSNVTPLPIVVVLPPINKTPITKDEIKIILNKTEILNSENVTITSWPSVPNPVTTIYPPKYIEPQIDYESLIFKAGIILFVGGVLIALLWALWDFTINRIRKNKEA